MSKVLLKSDIIANLPIIPLKKTILGNFLFTIIIGSGLILSEIPLENETCTHKENQVKPEMATDFSALNGKNEQITLISRYSIQITDKGHTTTINETALLVKGESKVIEEYMDKGDYFIQEQVIKKLNPSHQKNKKMNSMVQKSPQIEIFAELKPEGRKEKIDLVRANMQHLHKRLSLQVAKQERVGYSYQEKTIFLQQLGLVSFNNTLTAQLAEAESLLDELVVETNIENINKQKDIIKQLYASIKHRNLEINKSDFKSPYSGLTSEQLTIMDFLSVTFLILIFYKLNF
ncbi:hypothetical protein [Crocosphaera sp. Alani8]|uniref:hypothetical protein n=1 Tax=Crocosphaera sp. Alani8 TaxID=3038952 RepID=UPI00313DB256